MPLPVRNTGEVDSFSVLAVEHPANTVAPRWCGGRHDGVEAVENTPMATRIASAFLGRVHVAARLSLPGLAKQGLHWHGL